MKNLRIMTMFDRIHVNKQIVNFLGWERQMYNIYRIPESFLRVPSLTDLSSMKFDKDYNWIHRVIDHIKYIEMNQDKFFGDDYFNINFNIDLINGVDLRIDKQRLFMQTAFGEGQLLSAIVGAVLEFIKWFNEHDIRRKNK